MLTKKLLYYPRNFRFVVNNKNSFHFYIIIFPIPCQSYLFLMKSCYHYNNRCA